FLQATKHSATSRDIKSRFVDVGSKFRMAGRQCLNDAMLKSRDGLFQYFTDFTVIDLPVHRYTCDQVFASHQHRSGFVIGIGYDGPYLYFHLFRRLHADSHIVMPAEMILNSGVKRVTGYFQRLERGNARQGYDNDFGNASTYIEDEFALRTLDVKAQP